MNYHQIRLTTDDEGNWAWAVWTWSPKASGDGYTMLFNPMEGKYAFEWKSPVTAFADAFQHAQKMGWFPVT